MKDKKEYKGRVQFEGRSKHMQVSTLIANQFTLSSYNKYFSTSANSSPL
jgi:hypothetical protein